MQKFFRKYGIVKDQKKCEKAGDRRVSVREIMEAYNLMDKETKRWMLLITFGIILFAALMNFSAVLEVAKKGAEIILPIVVGLILAFVLNVPMKLFEKVFTTFKERHPRLKLLPVAGCSLFATLFCIALVVWIIYTMFVPGLAASVKSIYDVFMENVPQWLAWLRKNGIDTKWISRQISSWDLKTVVEKITGSAGNVLNTAMEVASSAFSLVINALMGFIIAIYVLLSKKSLVRQCKKFLYAHLKKRHADKICYVSRMVNDTYSRFFSGQCIEAIILGGLMFIAFTIFRLPYANLIAVLTAVLSFIPYIGAFASCGIGALLIIMVDPWQALLSIVVYQVVQFIENQFIYPRVVGGSVGLAPLWTLSAALIGGNLFGVVGMIFAIPITAVLYVLIKDDVNQRLEKKNVKIQ